jgi:iron complex outermembrane receptor protein
VKPVLLYAKVSRSYKAGGFNPYAVFFGQGTDPDTRTFKPEHVISYEAGFKADFRLGNVPVRFNTSLYEIHYNDIQRATGDYNPTTGAGGARTLNADAKIRGIEIEGSIRPWPGVEIGGNFSHTDAHYTKYSFVTGTGGLGCNGIVPPGGTVDASCLRFQYTAPYIWSLHASVDQPLAGNAGTLSLFVNYSHTASQYTEAVNVPAVQPGATIDAFGTLNASLDWRGVMGSKFDVGVFGTNITNELYRTSNADVYQQGGLLYWVTLYGEPRMYGVRLKYHFGGE